MKKILYILTLTVMLLTVGNLNAYAATNADGSITILNCTTKEIMNYYNFRINYACNGQSFNLKETTPGIIYENGTALAPCHEVFELGLGLDCTYDMKNLTVTITNGRKTVKLTVDSKIAYVDGKQVTISAPPRYIRYLSSNTTRILVPSRFVTEAFGFNYYWNSTEGNVYITGIPALSIKSGDTFPKDTNGLYAGYHSGLKVNGAVVPGYGFQAIKIDNVIMIPAYKSFVESETGVKYSFYQQSGAIQLSAGNITIDMQLNSNIAYVNGVAMNCGIAPCLVKNEGTGEEAVYVPAYFTAESLGIDYTRDSIRSMIVLENSSNFGKAASVYPNGIVSNIPSYSSGLKSNQLVINIPINVTASKIYDYDNYLNRQIEIYIKGDYVSYIKNNAAVNTHPLVESISVSLTSNGHTKIAIKTIQIQAYKYSVKNGYIVVTIDNPKEIYDKIIVLDPGHGGKDPGAIRNYKGVEYYEKTIDHIIMCDYLQYYFNNSDSGIKVYYTSLYDTYMYLYERSAFANDVQADFFISLHCNANSVTSVNGTYVYYSKYNDNTALNGGLNSNILGQKLVNAICEKIGTVNKGLVDSNLVVTRENLMPAVLIELGFMTNDADLEKLIDPKYQDLTAQAIYNTVIELYKKY